MSESNETRRTILYVEDDNDTRPGIKRLLNANGYRVVVANDEDEIMERARDGRIHANLLLIDLGMPPGDALDAGRRIRLAALLDGESPLIVIAFRYGADMEGQDVNVGERDWVTYLQDAEQLERLVKRLAA